jgi:hypothetical protein
MRKKKSKKVSYLLDFFLSIFPFSEATPGYILKRYTLLTAWRIGVKNNAFWQKLVGVITRKKLFFIFRYFIMRYELLLDASLISCYICYK